MTFRDWSFRHEFSLPAGTLVALANVMRGPEILAVAEAITGRILATFPTETERDLWLYTHTTPVAQRRPAMSGVPEFFWDGESATISAGVARLRLQGLDRDPLHWALFDGFKQLGLVARHPKDTTSFGEQMLWTRISALLSSIGQDPNQWDFRPGQDTL